MEVIIQPNAGAASALAARLVARCVREKPNAVVGLATGSTPLMLYRDLAALHRAGTLDMRNVTTFNLDEYVGLAPSHPCSYARFMRENLFEHVGIDAARTHVPNGMAADVPAECAAYETSIRNAGGIDVQVLGIGSDGHIGFNEPSSSLSSRTRIKTLTDQTRQDNARFFASMDEVPRHCITMGIGTIMEARQVILLAFGSTKADIVARAVEGPITAMVPASILQMHPDAKVFLDEPAAARLERHDYYRWVFDGKPEWQKF